MNNKKQTSFINFLVETFSFGDFASKTNVETSRGAPEKEERKSGFYESTKLKKVLSIFIEDEGGGKEDRDDKKSMEWKQAIVAKSLEMHNSKRKKEEQNRKSVYSVREKPAKEKKETSKGLLFQPWAVGVAGACLAALFFSVSIVYFSPDVANRIACNADKTIINAGRALYIVPVTVDLKGLEEINNNKTTGILTREMRADFILRNKNQLKEDLRIDKTLRLSFEDITGRVAGMAEENYDHSGVKSEEDSLLDTGFKRIIKTFKRFINNFEIDY
ncbi:hypothetical protein K8R32_03260 [bacterium]|nr:hypothetical protein [bacterium]